MSHLIHPLSSISEINEEIKDEHNVLIQNSINTDENDENEDENEWDNEWIHWERENLEVRKEKEVESYQPIGWAETQQWLFVLKLFHNLLFVLKLSLVDVQLPVTPVFAIQMMQFIQWDRSPQARLKLFVKYSTRYFNLRKVPLVKGWV